MSQADLERWEARYTRPSPAQPVDPFLIRADQWGQFLFSLPRAEIHQLHVSFLVQPDVFRRELVMKAEPWQHKGLAFAVRSSFPKSIRMSAKPT